MRKFEYLSVRESSPMSGNFSIELNRLGREGWELVSVIPLATIYKELLYTFKREVAS